MSDTATNPRAVPGDNSAVDYGRDMTAQLERDYSGPFRDVDTLLEEARAMPREVNDEETAGKFAALIKRIRDHAKALTAYHVKEKLPHKSRGEAVDQSFFGRIDKLAKRAKANQNGAADVLFLRYDDYNQRKLRAIQIENERIAREAAEEADRTRREAEAKAQEEEEARLAAERARAPAQIDKKEQAATEAAVVADAAKVDAIIADDAAAAAALKTQAKPSDLVRERYDGVMGTMQTEKFAEIIDRKLLDKEALWPFLKTPDLQVALNAWAASTGHTEQMPGARVGKRPKSRIK